MLVCRGQGTIREICKGVGRDVKGLSIKEVFPPGFESEVFAVWNSVVEQRRSVWGAGQMWLEEKSYLNW
jgi:hypothetical protein